MKLDSTNALMFLHAHTSLHPGAGTALGAVDLPVQRERHTQWPTIAGSSLKGVLRDTCRPVDTANKESGDYKQWVSVFGPETEDADKHAGAVSITDARILAFPVRSLKGVFGWVTCPAVLGRLQSDLGLVGQNSFNLKDQSLEESRALCAENSPLLVDNSDRKQLVLEEFDFTRTGDCGQIADWISNNAAADNFTKLRIRSHFVTIHDDFFTHFVRHATEVTARIGLNYETKTVKSGALFYKEFLPAETLMYAIVIAQPSCSGSDQSGRDNLEFVRTRVRPTLQIGGDETTGKGLCAVRFSNGTTQSETIQQPEQVA